MDENPNSTASGRTFSNETEEEGMAEALRLRVEELNTTQSWGEGRQRPQRMDSEGKARPGSQRT